MPTYRINSTMHHFPGVATKGAATHTQRQLTRVEYPVIVNQENERVDVGSTVPQRHLHDFDSYITARPVEEEEELLQNRHPPDEAPSLLSPSSLTIEY